jgi:hypothetical protein
MGFTFRLTGPLAQRTAFASSLTSEGFKTD